MTMAESNEPVEPPDAAMTRLEAALDRIERSARPGARLEADPAAQLEESAVAARLDTLIMHLRSALAEATV
jgi:hypothetical protein